MKNFLLILAFTACVFLMAFVSENSKKFKPGTYGTEQVSIEFTSDHHFHYIHSGASINIEGSWSLDGDKILIETNEKTAAPKVWKMDHKYQCISGRQKAEFLRLCLN